MQVPKRVSKTWPRPAVMDDTCAECRIACCSFGRANTTAGGGGLGHRHLPLAVWSPMGRRIGCFASVINQVELQMQRRMGAEAICNPQVNMPYSELRGEQSQQTAEGRVYPLGFQWSQTST